MRLDHTDGRCAYMRLDHTDGRCAYMRLGHNTAAAHTCGWTTLTTAHTCGWVTTQSLRIHAAGPH